MTAAGGPGLPTEVPPQAVSPPFWKRLVALLIDYAFLLAATGGAKAFARDAFPGSTGDLFAAFVGFVASVAYFAGFEGSPRQATLGKMVFGITVASASGQRMSWKQATARSLLKTMSVAAPVLAIISAVMIWKRQDHAAIHDVAVSTEVLAGGSPPPAITQR